MTGRRIPHKTCKDCQQSKPLTEFYKSGRDHKDGHHNRCASCYRDKNRRWASSESGQARIKARHQRNQSIQLKRKKCARCLRTRLAKQFRIDRTKKGALTSYCRDCDKKWRSLPEQRKKHREAILRQYHRNKSQQGKRYGLSPQEYEMMLERQNGKCAICGKPDPRSGLHLDHNHATNKAREFLCRFCNMGLGCFQDSIEGLQTAIEYLKRHG